jgi:hypothetical protein
VPAPSLWDEITQEVKAAVLDPAAAINKQFKKVMGGDTKLKDAPESIVLPKELDEGMQKAMKESYPGGKPQEQGGIFVEKADGTMEWREGPAGKQSSFRPNRKDAQPGEKIVGTGHTHPNAPFKTGQGAGFSWQDIANMIKNPEEAFKMVQSGGKQFMSAVTRSSAAPSRGLTTPARSP